MSLSMMLEQILVQKLVSSQAKKFQEKKFSSKVRIVLARIARIAFASNGKFMETDNRVINTL